MTEKSRDVIRRFVQRNEITLVKNQLTAQLKDSRLRSGFLLPCFISGLFLGACLNTGVTHLAERFRDFVPGRNLRSHNFSNSIPELVTGDKTLIHLSDNSKNVARKATDPSTMEIMLCENRSIDEKICIEPRDFRSNHSLTEVPKKKYGNVISIFKSFLFTPFKRLLSFVKCRLLRFGV